MEEFLFRIDEVRWRLSMEAMPGMKVPGLIYADKEIMEQALGDNALAQVANVACLPGIQNFSFAMPDIHQGYGFPIGGVAAFDLQEGVISPGGVGYDICCGVRLLVSDIEKEQIIPVLDSLASSIYSRVPSGVGSKVSAKLSQKELQRVLERGAVWAVEKGMGETGDLDFIENRGRYEQADPSCVSDRAKKRGLAQLGTLGSGNHFLEVQVVDRIFERSSADVMGLREGAITVMVHCGSRGLGHQVCDDYIRVMARAMGHYGIRVPDRQLCSVPVLSREGKDYMGAMYSAANFALANRQIITSRLREVFSRFFSGRDLKLLYDVSHNMAQVEEHSLGTSSPSRVCVHRKGATRALPPGHPLLPELYRETGQPVLVPGSMGTASYVLAGTARGGKECFASTCHGAGRIMSRHSARKETDGNRVRQELKQRGIIVKAESLSTVSEEKPSAYKNVERVIEVVEKAGIGKKIARLRPLAVIKG